MRSYARTGAGATWENAERGKAAKMRQSNAEIEQNLPMCDLRIWRVSKSGKYAIVRENGGQGRHGRMRREEKLPKYNCRMLRLSKSCQNATVECGERAKASNMRSCT